MNINKKYLIMNCAVAGVFGVITGKLVGYYKGLSEGLMEAIEEKSKEWAEINADLSATIKEQADELKKYDNELKKYDNEEFKEWMSLKTSFNLNKGAFADFLKEKREEKEAEERKEKAKEAIKNKEWDEVYRMTERWYNHYPVQMSRSEVFTNLEKDGYITQEERTEAYNYFGSLWNYVGD